MERNAYKNYLFMYICMSVPVRIELSEEQHERLTELKDRRGYTWKGLMLEGAKCLES
jgi:hypothetical protein